MAAVASAVIGAPIAGVMIILEMTMNYDMALAAMLSVVTCSMISHLLFGHSFFDRQLLDRGIDVAQGRGHIEMMETPVLGIVSDDFARDTARKRQRPPSRSLSLPISRRVILSRRTTWLVGKVSLQRLVSLRQGATLKGACRCQAAFDQA